jgi:hypothetical protein
MYQQPPSNYWQPGQFLPPPPPPKPTLRQRFSQLPRKTKFGLGCSTLLLIFAMCVCSSVAANTGSRTGTPVADAQSTAAPTQPPTPAPTVEPTKAPTAKPTTMAVKQAVPTLVPTKAPTPKPVPTQPPAPQPTTPPKGVNGNPWGYNFTPGNLIYTPASAFCSYFACVSTFWTKTNGYVAECVNGEYTHSGGISGACSRDGGVAQILYSH